MAFQTGYHTSVGMNDKGRKAGLHIIRFRIDDGMGPMVVKQQRTGEKPSTVVGVHASIVPPWVQRKMPMSTDTQSTMDLSAAQHKDPVARPGQAGPDEGPCLCIYYVYYVCARYSLWFLQEDLYKVGTSVHSTHTVTLNT